MQFLPSRFRTCGFTKLLALGLAVNTMLVVFQFAEFNLVPISRSKLAAKQVPNGPAGTMFDGQKDDVLVRKLNQMDNLTWKEKSRNIAAKPDGPSGKLPSGKGQSLQDSLSHPLLEGAISTLQSADVSASQPEDNGSKLKFDEDWAKETSPTELKDIFFSVKTTAVYHTSRVKRLIDTWVQLAQSQVYFFTDSEDENLKETLGPNVINTHCDAGHQRNALCCKMQAEFEFFLQKFNGRWFCHFDDDNYVNVPTLVRLLKSYPHTQSVYLGKASLPQKMKCLDRDQGEKPVSFWFATGGAGFCISKALMLRMDPYVSKGKFLQACSRIRLPDDCTVGFISEVLLNTTLTQSPLFHSHLERLSALQLRDLEHQVTLSHGYIGKYLQQVEINGPFSHEEDPSRFKSIHCFLNPSVSWCPPKMAT